MSYMKLPAFQLKKEIRLCAFIYNQWIWGDKMGIFDKLFKSDINNCEVCGRRMKKIESGHGYVMLSVDQATAGVGVAEECRECSRLYCDHCYPSRPPNTCVCEKGRDSIHTEGGTVFKGSLKLVKVRYLD